MYVAGMGRAAITAVEVDARIKRGDFVIREAIETARRARESAMKTRATATRLRSESRAIRAESFMLRVVANWDRLEPLMIADAKLNGHDKGRT